MLPPTPSSQPCRYPQEGSRLVAVCAPSPPPSPAHLKHLLYVAVFALQQLPPRGEVAVGEDPPGSQQAEGMVLLGGGRGGQRYPTPRPPIPPTPHPPPYLDEGKLVRVPGLCRQWVRVV